jgi:hypothetical protein
MCSADQGRQSEASGSEHIVSLTVRIGKDYTVEQQVVEHGRPTPEQIRRHFKDIGIVRPRPGMRVVVHRIRDALKERLGLP